MNFIRVTCILDVGLM